MDRYRMPYVRSTHPADTPAAHVFPQPFPLSQRVMLSGLQIQDDVAKGEDAFRTASRQEY